MSDKPTIKQMNGLLEHLDACDDLNDSDKQIKQMAHQIIDLLKDRVVYRVTLHDLHARMVDVYDGAPDSTNHLPFTGGDIRDIEEVLR